MKKDPTQKKCDWCKKWFGTIRKGRFCSDLHRVRWHRQAKLDQDLAVFKALRKALEYCLEQHPELDSAVNKILSDDLPLSVQKSDVDHQSDDQSVDP